MTEAEDRCFLRPFPIPACRHPKYKGKVIPAFEMTQVLGEYPPGLVSEDARSVPYRRIKGSSSLPKQVSILKEVKAITEMPDFKG